MATYYVRGYSNTGFNAVNIPDSLVLLHEFSYKDFPAIEVLQDLDLTTIRIKATWNQAQNLDYIELFRADPLEVENILGFCYIVTNVVMQATDVAVLSVVMDYYNTCGGITNVEILDGITNRVHTKSDATPVGWHPDSGNGIYVNDDPLMAPADNLYVEVKYVDFGGDDYDTYIETSIDLTRTQLTANASFYTAVDPDETDNVQSMIVPRVIPSNNTTWINGKSTSTTSNSHSLGTRYYKVNDTHNEWSGDNDATVKNTIDEGVQLCRSLGIEDAITNKVIIPSKLVKTSIVYQGWSRTYKDGTSKRRTDQMINSIEGADAIKDVDISDLYNYSVTPKNKRLLYGSYTPIGMMTTSGDKITLNMEQVYLNETSARIATYVDPTLDGCVTYALVRNDIDPDSIKGYGYGLMMTGIKGLPWKKVPLKYNEAKGNILNSIELNNSRNIANTEASNAYRSYQYDKASNQLNTLMGAMSSATSMAGGANAAIADRSTSVLGMNQGLVKSFGSNLQGLVGSMTQGYLNSVALDTSLENTKASYYAAKAAEMSQYAVKQNIFIPEVKFPYNFEYMRDNYGEGVMLFRYKYSIRDINRIDKLLTMYGYNYIKPLETSDFNNRPYFNYIECSNVTLGCRKEGHLPMRLLDGMSTQLKAGVRIWHVRPDNKYYTSGNVAS